MTVKTLSVVFLLPAPGRKGNLGRRPINSTEFRDILKYDPFLGTLLAVPSKGISEQSGTEVASANRKRLAGGLAKEPFQDGERWLRETLDTVLRGMDKAAVSAGRYNRGRRHLFECHAHGGTVGTSAGSD